MEPSLKTYQEVGRLCSAWSYLEMLSERTLWGILDLNAKLAQAFVWRMQLSSKWQMIVREAKKSLPESDALTLKALAKSVNALARDRNIVIHGHVTALAQLPDPLPPPGGIIGPITDPLPFTRQPCWTIYMGEDAGKNFPISCEAVEIIVLNIQKVAEEILTFNMRRNFTEGTKIGSEVEEGWPIPL